MPRIVVVEPGLSVQLDTDSISILWVWDPKEREPCHDVAASMDRDIRHTLSMKIARDVN